MFSSLPDKSQFGDFKMQRNNTNKTGTKYHKKENFWIGGQAVVQGIIEYEKNKIAFT